MTLPEPAQVRVARPADAFQLAPLLSASQEPHFHTTAERLVRRLEADPSGYAVGETARGLSGVGTLWLPDVHATHAWVGLHLHPDHRADGTAAALLNHLALQARAAGRARLWASVREDYLPTWSDLPALGFREVHRTFGGGFHLADWKLEDRSRQEALTAQGYCLTPAAPFQEDVRLPELYTLTRSEKVTAEPTIGPAGEALTDGAALCVGRGPARLVGGNTCRNRAARTLGPRRLERGARGASRTPSPGPRQRSPRGSGAQLATWGRGLSECGRQRARRGVSRRAAAAGGQHRARLDRLGA